MATNTIPRPVTRNSAPFSASLNNGNSASTLLVETDITDIGASFIITVNRRGNAHEIRQAVVGLTTGYVDLVMTAGSGLTAALVSNGFTVAIPSYSNVSVISCYSFKMSWV